MKRLVSAAAAVIMLLSLYGCGRLEDAFNDDTVKMVNYPASMTDSIGNTVTLEKPAQRVVVTDYTTLNAAVLLGIGPQIVGYNKDEADGELIYEMCPELEKACDICENGEVSTERIIEADPDIVFMPWAQKEIAAELFESGIPVQVFSSASEQPTLFSTSLYMISSLTCESSTRSTEIGTLQKSILDDLSGYNYKIPFDERKKVLFLDEHDMCTAAVSGADKIINLLMEKAGGNNAAETEDCGDGSASFDSKQVKAWNPDVIWVPHFADYAIEDVMESEVFKDTNAVKNGDVYLFPSGLEPWYENTAAACLGGCWALYNLYPEVYSFKNLKSTIETYYKTVYGKNCDLNALGIE